MSVNPFALDEFIQIVNSLYLLIQFNFNTNFILKIHKKFHSIQRVNTKFRELTFRLHDLNIAAGAFRNNPCDSVKIHDNYLQSF